MNNNRLDVALVMAAACMLACSSEDTNTPANPVPGGGSGGSSGTVGIAGGGAAGTTGGAGGVENMNPTLLSETGLYADIATDAIAPGVLPFTPQFQLWSDNAAKRRWVYLPPGATINTSNQDFWTYPQGTKFWKEFARDGIRVETRILWKQGQGAADWFMVAFKWNAEQTEATAVPDGELDASGTMHDIPSQEACSTCHRNMRDRAIGFSAVQLSYTAAPGDVTLDQLVQMGALSAAPAAALAVPGTEVDKQAFGYLHANCGMCHNERANVFITKINDMNLWLHSTADALCTTCGDLASPQTTAPYLGLVNKATKKGNILGATVRVTPGDLDASALYQVMNTRDAIPGVDPEMMGADGGVAAFQMPPLGSEIVDPDGLAKISAWITSLPP